MGRETGSNLLCYPWQNFELAIFGTKHKSLLKYTDAVILHIKRRSSQLDKDFEFRNWDLDFSFLYFFYCAPQSQLKKFISPNASRRETHATMRGFPRGGIQQLSARDLAAGTTRKEEGREGKGEGNGSSKLALTGRGLHQFVSDKCL